MLLRKYRELLSVSVTNSSNTSREKSVTIMTKSKMFTKGKDITWHD